MSLSFHIAFNGNCQEAFQFYSDVLPATLGHMLQVKDSPMSAHEPISWQHKIVHGNLSLQGVNIAGADVKPEQYQKPSGFYLLLSFSSETLLLDAFSQLAIEGEVILAPQTTFWSSCYGIVIDRFGLPWKLNCVDQ